MKKLINVHEQEARKITDPVGFDAEQQERREVAQVHMRWAQWRTFRKRNTELLKQLMDENNGEDVFFAPELMDGMPVPVPNWDKFDIHELWMSTSPTHYGDYIINGQPADPSWHGWKKIR